MRKSSEIVGTQFSRFSTNNRTYRMVEIAQQELSEDQLGPYVHCS